MRGWIFPRIEPHGEGEEKPTFSFIDVLFGLAIAAVFEQLVGWPDSWIRRLHLIAGAVLVVGSYVGYRSSKNSTSYKYLFANPVALLRFVVDQLMLILYFGFALLTKDSDASDSRIVGQGLLLLVWVFGLYLVWDLLGWYMRVKYKGDRSYDTMRLWITSGALVLLGGPLVLWCVSDITTATERQLVATESWMIAILVVYRTVKDART